MTENSVFITNSQTKQLKKRLIDLIKSSSELKFLVGFFYYSGIRELYEGLKENSSICMKVLVGLSVSNDAFGLVEYGENVKELTLGERVQRFYQSIENSVNSDDFDTKEFYEQIKFFIEMIQDGKLIIRRTKEPNHSKLYFFNLTNSLVKPKLFITGSSNLTKAGLSTQREFNVELSDFGTIEAELYFNSLWDESDKITETEKYKKDLIRILQRKTLITEITPYEAYATIIKNYLDVFTPKDSDGRVHNLLESAGYKPYTYQIDAVSQALEVIKEYNGVILADVVGLGKTVIACAIANLLNERRGLILCPPGLMGDNSESSGWRKYTKEFDLHGWQVRSIGDLENTWAYIKEQDGYNTVIIDEAHRFRNEDTESYETLLNICKDRKVILLTATPFNNSPADIFALLKLFVVPGKSKLTLEDDLDITFRIYQNVFDKLSFINKNHNSSKEINKKKSESIYKALFDENSIDLSKVRKKSHYISKQIRQVIEPVLIRRNRKDLKEDPFYKKEKIELSILKDPEEIFFKLSKEQSEFYDKVINEYFCEGGMFKGAIYRPFFYEKELKKSIGNKRKKEKNGSDDNRDMQMQVNLYDFMRRLLVKRFESSFGAFEKSISNFEKIHLSILEFIINSDFKYILDRQFIEKIHELDYEQISIELVKYIEKIKDKKEIVNPKKYRVYNVKEFYRKEEFIKDIQNDICLFQIIKKELKQMELVNNDPKVTEIYNEIERLIKNNKNAKIVLFTEYIDTAKHIEAKFKSEGNNTHYVVKDELNKSKVEEIIKNFDASSKIQENNYNILITTDKMSEGFNLNRAFAVINYDIPWNPTRVIQRVGRINRIGKKVFDYLYIYNIFPSERGADIIKSRQIAQNKMYMIHNTLGEDSKIFDVDEVPEASKLYKKILQNPNEIEDAGFYTKLRREYAEMKEDDILVEKIKNMPIRIKVAKKYDNYYLDTFIRKGKGFFIRSVEGGKNGVVDSAMEDIIHRVKCEKDEHSYEISEKFWENYENTKNPKKKTEEVPEMKKIETEAYNNLKSILEIDSEKLLPLKEDLRKLLRNIEEYKTLPLYSLRRIRNIVITDDNDKLAKEIKTVLDRINLGSSLSVDNSIKKEVIIAVENRNDI
ncbi:MAG: helicase-related protein [bacterium]